MTLKTYAVPMSGHSTIERYVVTADARRRWSRTEKLAMVGETAANTVSAVARKHNLAPSLLFRWRRQSEGRATTPATAEGRFVPVMLAARRDGKSTSSAGTGLSCIEIELVGGRRIRVDGSGVLGSE